VLGELDSKLRFRENAVFAWIPTITSVSRQAAEPLHGEYPYHRQGTGALDRINNARGRPSFLTDPVPYSM